jgi:hypothetical protein
VEHSELVEQAAMAIVSSREEAGREVPVREPRGDGQELRFDRYSVVLTPGEPPTTATVEVYDRLSALLAVKSASAPDPDALASEVEASLPPDA